MATVWTPPNISPVCAEQAAPLTQCSPAGYMFLTLVTQLFGRSIDSQALPKNPYAHALNRHIPEQFPGSDFISQLQPYSDAAPYKHFHHHHHHHRPRGGFTQTTFYGKPEFASTFDDNFKFPTFGPFDFNLLSRRSYSDTDAADSKKVTVTAKKERKERRRKRHVHASHEYDFIIVGAGSAGCVIANRLSEVKKWKILLLEAGPEEPEVTSVPAFAPTLGRSNIDWMYRTQPEELTCRSQRGQTCPWLSGRVMGGSSAINYMVYMRGNKRDYDEWATLGNYGWSYNEVLPYFKRTENNRDIEAKDTYHHGVHGPLTVERFTNVDINAAMLVQTFEELGLPLTDFNGAQQLGTMILQTTTQDGKRMSVNRAFIRPVRKNRYNLHIINEAQVTGILIKPDSYTAYGVKYTKNGKTFEVHAKKEIILSAGALNSPKLLMLSGIGPRHDLELLKISVLADLKVGYNLQDHATTDAMVMELSNKTSTIIDGDQISQEVKKYYEYRNGPLSTTGPLHVTAFIRTEYAPEDKIVPDIQFHFDGRNLKQFYSDPTTYLASNVFPLTFYNSLSVRPILLAPESRGYLTLNKTHPLTGQPLIYPRFFTVKKDIDTLVAALRYAFKMEDTQVFKNKGVRFFRRPIKGCEQFVWGTYDYLACLFISYTTTIYHPSGTCKMGPQSDKSAVVDPRLRVYGIKHLRVADASIMPNIVRGNTNAPVMMIGEKLSDMIKEDWKY